MTASRILGGNNNATSNPQHHNNVFRSIPPQQFNNAPPVFDNNNNAYAQALPLAEYQFVPNEIIVSPASIYKVLQFLGKGTFGQVVKCWRLSSDDNSGNSNARGALTLPKLNRVEMVALKVLKSHPSYERQAQTEAAVLGQLSREGIAGKFNVVQPHEFFRHKGHSCLVFEALDINLYEYLKCNQFRPLLLEHIRVIAQQVLVALAKLKSMGLIHADLKPENIMLVDSVQKPFRVKVIDFGSACFASNITSTTYLQSRYYRAPEIILGLTYNEAIDMWSLGCVLAELYLGWPLYPGASEYDQIRYIIQAQGMPSDKLLKKANKTRQFFEQVALWCSSDRRDVPEGASGVPAVGPVNQFRWNLKTPEAYERETGIKPKEARKYVMKSLKDLQMVGAVAPLEQCSFLELNSSKADKRCFVNLLESILHLDSRARMAPLDALSHPFITMAHLRDLGHSRLFSRSIALMNTCIQVTPQDLEGLSGGQRCNVSRVTSNLTSTASYMGMGANPPATYSLFQHGIYPLHQFFLDQAQIPLTYAFPPIQHPLHPYHLSSLMLTNPTAVVPRENAYPLVGHNSRLIPSNQQQPKMLQRTRPQVPQIFDSLQGMAGGIREAGRPFRLVCTASNAYNPPQHLNVQAPVSDSRFRRGKQEQRSKKNRNQGTQRNVASLGHSNVINGASQHQGHPVPRDRSLQAPNCHSMRQQPWHSRRNGGSCPRRPEFGSEGEAPGSSNGRNDNGLGGINNNNSQPRLEGNNSTCQDSSLERPESTFPVQLRPATSGIQNAQNVVSASVGEPLGYRKERISQDSGIGRATLPSPNQDSVVASDSSDDSSSSGADLLSGFDEVGGRLMDVMRNLQLPGDGAEAFLRDPPIERAGPSIRLPERVPDPEAWIQADRAERGFEDALLAHTPARRILDYDPETLESLRLFNENARLPRPTSYANVACRSQMGGMAGPNTGPGTGRHVHQQVMDNRENCQVPQVANQMPSAMEFYPCQYQQQHQQRLQRQANNFLLQQQSQNVGQSTLFLYQPQQFQAPQVFPGGPLCNVQPNRVTMPQPSHPSSIVLLSPEGNPSVYTLSYTGSLVAAPTQGLNCGFYTLGNPMAHQPNPINPQGVQYIYQA